MAPEINHIYGPETIPIRFKDRIDIYSLGCIIWDMHYGKVFKQERKKHPDYKEIDIFDYKDVPLPKTPPISGMLLDLITRCL